MKQHARCQQLREGSQPTDEDCLEVCSDRAYCTGGAWNDASCDLTLPYIRKYGL